MEIKINSRATTIYTFFILFLMLKLDGVINWEWTWVFSPFWITWIASSAYIIIMEIVKGIRSIITSIKRNQTINTRHNSPKLYWDNENKCMYVPFEVTENE